MKSTDLAQQECCKNPTVPDSKFTSKAVLSHAAILACAAALLWFLLSGIVAPSERFNALLVPLWLLNFALRKPKVDQRFVVYGIGIGIGVLGFYLLGSAQARLSGARIFWFEPFQKLYFTAGLFVLYHLLCQALNGLISLVPTGHTLLKAPGGWWLRTLRAGAAICLFAPYIYVSFNAHRFKFASDTDPLRRCHLPFQNVHLTASDGAKLEGWYIPCARSKATIIGIHGVGSNRSEVLGVVPFLHRAGYNVFVFDLRAHGDSSGHTTSFGRDEARDVEAAAHWVKQQPGGQFEGILAYSMGGSAVLHTIGETGLPEVDAFILDSTFAEFGPLAREQMNFLPDSLADPLLAVLNFDTRLEIGETLTDIQPKRYIGKISPRPLLLIHGTADTLIPFAQARTNFASAREPKSLYLVDGAGHCGAYAVAGKAYEKRVTDFFNLASK